MMYENNRYSCNSNALTARMVAPCRAPADVKYRFTATRHSVRKKMSLFTRRKGMNSFSEHSLMVIYLR